MNRTTHSYSFAQDRYFLSFNPRSKKYAGDAVIWFRPDVNATDPYQASVYLRQEKYKMPGGGVYGTVASDKKFFNNWRDAETWASNRFKSMLGDAK